MALKAHLENVPQTIEGRGQARRSLKLETLGEIADGKTANVTVHNLSAAGLLIETDLTLRVGEALALDLPQVGPVGAEVVWQSDRLFGCAFEQALGEAALAAAELRGAIPGEVEPTTRAPLAIASASMDSLGARLNKLRRERGLTLAQVASALDVSKPTVWAWEKGKAKPLPERLAAIATVLGVELEELSGSGAGLQGAILVDECRLRIATEFGTDPNRVRIMIEV